MTTSSTMLFIQSRPAQDRFREFKNTVKKSGTIALQRLADSIYMLDEADRLEAFKMLFETKRPAVVTQLAMNIGDVPEALNILLGTKDLDIVHTIICNLDSFGDETRPAVINALFAAFENDDGAKEKIKEDIEYFFS